MSTKHHSPSLLFLLSSTVCITFSSATTFQLINKCPYTVWPGILSGAGLPQFSTTGFALPSGNTLSLPAPTSWSGRIWARTLCSTANATAFSCLTGDCGSPTVECAGHGAVPPATLAEFTLDSDGGLDFYDVSLVDGYNLPMVIAPRGGRNCSATGCYADLNGPCPVALRLTATTAVGGAAQSVACRSACEAFGDPQYCCSGAYSTPGACKPTGYSEYFKSACPSAYSYAYDDATSTFTCAGADYDIIFCPTPAAIKKSTSGEDTPAMSPAEAPALFSTATVTPSTTFTTPLLLLLALIWMSFDFFGYS